VGATPYDVIVDRILEVVEAEGQFPWQKPWRASIDGPRNATTGKPYRGINVWMLLMQSRRDPRWLTFKQALGAERCVRKGEHGTPIIFWASHTTRKAKDEDGDEMTVSQHRDVPILRYYTVFNVDQCDGLDLPPLAEAGPTPDPIEAAEAIVDAMPNRPAIAWDQPDRAYYSPTSDEVHLPGREQFAAPEEVYGTEFHELAHSTGHKSRLGRHEVEGLDHFGSDRYGREELVAEMTAAFLCGEAGIERVIDNSAAYVRNWTETIREDRRAVVVAAGKAQKAADYILGREAVTA